MNRSQRRASERAEQKKAKTYTFTEEQLHVYVREAFRKQREEIMNDTVNQAMLLMLTLPLEVLMDHYWQKSYAKRIPEFTKYVLEYYEQWQNGEIDVEDLKRDLWEYGGIRLEAER